MPQMAEASIMSRMPLSLLGDPGASLSEDKGQELSLWAAQEGTWDQEKDGGS